MRLFTGDYSVASADLPIVSIRYGLPWREPAGSQFVSMSGTSIATAPSPP